jgi:hypothetical protein
MGKTKTTSILERMENNMLKRYGQALQMGDNIWPERILTGWPEGRTEEENP